MFLKVKQKRCHYARCNCIKSVKFEYGTATESFSNGIDTALKYLSTAPPLQYDCGVRMF